MPLLGRPAVSLVVLCVSVNFSAGQVPADESFLHLDNAIVTTINRNAPMPYVARVDPYRNNGCLYILGPNYVDQMCNYASASPGATTRIVGSSVFGRRDGPLTTALFSHLQDMVFYDAGQLVLTGSSDNLLHLADLNSGVVSEFAGKGYNWATRDGVGTNAAFQNPYVLAINRAGGVVYVGGESNIRKVNWSTREVSKLSGDNGRSRGRVDGDMHVSRFKIVRGLTYHNSYVYAVDSGNSRIRRVDAATGETTSFVGYNGEGWRDGGPGVGQFSWPWGIVADGRTSPPVLYISTPNHHRIRVVNIDNRNTWTVAGWSKLNCDGIGTFASFQAPKGIGLDYHSTNPRIFVGDRQNNQIRMITRRTPNARRLTSSGDCTSSNKCNLCEGDCDNDDECSAGTLCFYRDRLDPVPGCLSGTNGDKNGRDYCTDSTTLTKHPTPAPVPLPAMSSLMGDRSNLLVTTVATGLIKPRFMDCDWTVGDCVVSSGDDYKVHRIKGGFEVSPLVIETAGSGARGTVDGSFTVAKFDRPGRAVLYGTVSYHPDRYGQKIRKIDWQAKVVDSATPHNGGGYVDGPFSVAKFRSPEGAEKYTSTSMFVASTARIHILDFADRIVDTAAGYTAASLDELRWGNSDGLCTNARMNDPYALSYDPTNRTLYFASGKNFRVRAVDLGAAQCTTRAVLGRREWAGQQDGPASMASFLSIYSIRYQFEPTRGTQYMFFTSHYSDRLRVWDMNADYVLHVAGWNHGQRDGWNTNARFSNPSDIVLREPGVSPFSFYIVDVDSGMIRKVGQLETSSPTASPVTASPTQSPSTQSPTTSEPTVSPTTQSPTSESPTTSSPTTLSPTTQSPTSESPTSASPTTSSPTTAGPSVSPSTASPTSGSPSTSSPTTLTPSTCAPTESPSTSTPTTAGPTETPTTQSPETGSPTETPSTQSPGIRVTGSPLTSNPATTSPVTAVPTGSPATQAPVTTSPSASPATVAPSTTFTLSPTQYSATCSPLAATLLELKAVLPTTNGTDGVCGQMNRGLNGLIDAGQYTQALNIINNSTTRVATLQTAPESCSAFLDFQCDAKDNVATTVQRLDVYMKSAFYRLQTLVATGGGNRNGMSLVQTMTQIVKTTALTQAERNDFSESAGNFTEAANATDLAQNVYGQDIADLFAALIDKNAEAAEAESAPMSSNACAAAAKAFGRVERLLHKAGTSLTLGGSARRLDTSMFESWSSRVDATGRGQLQPSGATLIMPRFSYQANSAATAGDTVVMVALRWKSRVDLCRTPSDLTLDSDIHTVSVLGDASRMEDKVYFATGETMDMTFTARASSSRMAQRTTGCSGPKECRWWNAATQAWDPSGCTYSETTESCTCTHLTDFAVVAPVVACPEADGGATSSGASSVLFVAAGVGAVVIGVIIYFVLRGRKRKRYGKVLRAKSSTVVPRTNSEERMNRSERGESKEAWVDPPISADVGSVGDDSNLLGDSAPTGESREATPRESSSTGGGTGKLLPESSTDGGNKEVAPSSPRIHVVDSSSESEGISNMTSHILPDFKAIEAGVGAVPESEPVPHETETPRSLDEKDTRPPLSSEEDVEYMRRCKSKFVTLSQEYEIDMAMDMYDKFLLRPRDDILAEPAHLYPNADMTVEPFSATTAEDTMGDAKDDSTGGLIPEPESTQQPDEIPVDSAGETTDAGSQDDAKDESTGGPISEPKSELTLNDDQPDEIVVDSAGETKDEGSQDDVKGADLGNPARGE